MLFISTDSDNDVDVMMGLSRVLQSSDRLSFMINANDRTAVGEGDRFYSTNDPQGRQPELTITTDERFVDDNQTIVPIPTTPPPREDAPEMQSNVPVGNETAVPPTGGNVSLTTTDPTSAPVSDSRRTLPSLVLMSSLVCTVMMKFVKVL
jgi:hypothetical protein